MSRAIAALDTASVHRICSGQVVTDLATAIKELVENSFDAGASSVEVRLKEYGTELIEVIDNGSGIDAANYEALTRKHWTSKLTNFGDLESVSTFGFRGEALSSLCALADVTVITATKGDGVGAKLVFDHEGALVSRTPISRNQGTTVLIANLFSTLPVRRKGFLKTSRADYAKAITLLQAYAVTSPGKRLVCVHQTKSSRDIVFATSAQSRSMLDVISSVYGKKDADKLVSYLLDIPLTSGYNDSLHRSGEGHRSTHQSHYSSSTSTSSRPTSTTVLPPALNPSTAHVRIVGYISRLEKGAGRSSPDRQFLYLNGRPVDLPKLARAISDTYRLFSVGGGQFSAGGSVPTFYLDVQVPPGHFDVNITPNKRTVYVTGESDLVTAIKDDLTRIYTGLEQRYQVNQSVQSMLTSLTGTSHIDDSPTSTSSPHDHLVTSAQKDVNVLNHDYEIEEEKQTTYQTPTSPSLVNTTPPTSMCYNHTSEGWFDRVDASAPNRKSGWLKLKSSNNEKQMVQDSRLNLINPHEVYHNDLPSSLSSQAATLNPTPSSASLSPSNTTNPSPPSQPRSQPAAFQNIKVHVDWSTILTSFCRNSSKQKQRKAKGLRVDGNPPISEEFRAPSSTTSGVSLPTQVAETILSRTVHKEDFGVMDVIGQFNLGFIVARLRGDLYIIDQHAADEKYRFETLRSTTVIQHQPLVRPFPLPLSPAQETIVLEHLPLFRANGFDIANSANESNTESVSCPNSSCEATVGMLQSSVVNDMYKDGESVPQPRRLLLRSLPFSRSTVFGPEDINQLCTLIEQDPLGTHRIPKLDAMFASRACRSAVMIGTRLPFRTMRSIIAHMQGMEHPWACPHGRPTMRHLVDINGLRNFLSSVSLSTSDISIAPLPP